MGRTLSEVPKKDDDAVRQWIEPKTKPVNHTAKLPNKKGGVRHRFRLYWKRAFFKA